MLAVASRWDTEAVQKTGLWEVSREGDNRRATAGSQEGAAGAETAPKA